uniref:Uncharacterized protein n=2 Tax=Caenorhabditis japonica TaxID=281687 RepID=A0A8R1ELM3_CAEJA
MKLSQAYCAWMEELKMEDSISGMMIAKTITARKPKSERKRQQLKFGNSKFVRLRFRNELRHSTFVPPANALDHGKFVYRKRGSAAKHCRVALESVEASCGKELAVGEAITQLADEPGLKKRTWNGFDGPASACHKTGREEQEDEY